ncbi:DNA polymerase [Labrys neptuniae]
MLLPEALRRVWSGAAARKRRLAFDIETNGLLDTLTRTHCLVFKDVDTEQVFDFSDDKYGPGSIERGLRHLMKAKRLIGHNIIKFDIPAIAKVYPWFDVDGIEIEDTLVESRLLWTDLKDSDGVKAKQGRFPGKLIGSHALEAWGYRLGKMKGEYGKDENGKKLEGIWDAWNEEMHSYCIQDVEVTFVLWKKIQKAQPSEYATYIEHRFAEILAMQERRGFAFDVQAAQRLYSSLVEKRLEITERLKHVFPPKEVHETIIPKVNNRTRGYVKGVPFTKTKLVEFNPASRKMIGERLMAMGWEPTEYTSEGQPKIDETILSKLPHPEAKVLAELFTIDKRIGQLAEGDQAWLRLERNGRIHGSVNTNGAVTGRCTHSKPNVAQVPKCGSPYGKECRSLFMASTGMVLVGADLSGVELRCLAHYMSRYDDGAYGRTVCEGKEDDGTDVHSVNCRALGLEPKTVYVVFGKQQTGRNLAKTFIYAFLYGAGDEKLGSIVGVSEEEIAAYPKEHPKRWAKAVDSLRKQKRKLTRILVAQIVKGGLLKDNFLKAIPAIARLRQDVQAKVKASKELRALDGRILAVRHMHAALNTLLQNAGALVAKLATIIAYDELTARGYAFGRDWSLVAHIHDELQCETREDLADVIGPIIVQSMAEAGRLLGFRVPITGAWKKGITWADTH